MLLHYCVKYEQVEFCENSHCCTFSCSEKDADVIRSLRYWFWLILIATRSVFLRDDINLMPFKRV